MTNLVGSLVPLHPVCDLWALIHGREHVRVEHLGQVYLNGEEQILHSVEVEKFEFESGCLGLEGPASGDGSG